MDPDVRARALLRDAAPLLESLLTTVAVGVLVSDLGAPDAPIVYVNPAFERITGYSADAVLGRNCRFLQGEDTDPEAVAAMRTALAENREITTTLRNYRRDGTPFWNEVRLAPVPGADGDARFYLGLVNDVTARVDAEHELASVQALHTSVFNVVAEGILVLDRLGAVLDANPAALGILELDRRSLELPGWWDRLDARYPDGTPFGTDNSQGLRAVREQRPIPGVQMEVRRGDGARRLLSVNYEPMRSPAGEPEGVILSFRDVTERQRTLEDLQRFAALVSLSSDFVAIAALDQSVLYLNEAGRDLVGLDSLEEARTKQIADFLTPEGLKASLEVEQPAVLATGRWEGEGTLRHFKTGAAIPVRISSFLVRHPDSAEPWALATVQRDISEEQRITADLLASRERYEAQFQSLPVPTYVWRRTGEGDFVLIEWNVAAEELTGGAIRSLDGARASALYDEEPEILLAFERAWSTRRPVTNELFYRMKSIEAGKHLVITHAFVPPDLVLVHTQDITQRVEYEQELRRMTLEDDLTGLHNRRYFEDQLSAALGRQPLAVVIVDVDHFKFVNDSLGHGPGDELLREVASTMRHRLRDEDVLARFGGDEFAVLLTGASAAQAEAAANNLLAGIRAGVTGVSVTASAGVAVFAADSPADTSDAVVAADIALYKAKQLGRDRVEVYTGQAGDSLTWLAKIRSAIASERLVLHGQRVLDLRDPERQIFELLVRLIGEDGEVIPPSSFLPTAEQFGLIRDIDRWVVRHGLQFAARGHQVSVNLSARSIADPELPRRVADALAGTGARAENVTFEFTETAAISNLEEARAQTSALRDLGCSVALDDFGTGFATLVLFKHLPVGSLKIDMEFVRGLSTSSADQRIVRAIVAMAQDAGMRTVAEGVEDAGALSLLREYGVDYAQGFHIHRPEPLPTD